MYLYQQQQFLRLTNLFATFHRSSFSTTNLFPHDDNAQSSITRRTQIVILRFVMTLPREPSWKYGCDCCVHHTFALGSLLQIVEQTWSRSCSNSSPWTVARTPIYTPEQCYRSSARLFERFIIGKVTFQFIPSTSGAHLGHVNRWHWTNDCLYISLCDRWRSYLFNNLSLPLLHFLFNG